MLVDFQVNSLWSFWPLILSPPNFNVLQHIYSFKWKRPMSANLCLELPFFKNFSNCIPQPRASTKSLRQSPKGILQTQKCEYSFIHLFNKIFIAWYIPFWILTLGIQWWIYKNSSLLLELIFWGEREIAKKHIHTHWHIDKCYEETQRGYILNMMVQKCLSNEWSY